MSYLIHDTIEPGAVGNVFTAFAEAALADGYGQKPGGVWGIQEQPHTLDPITRSGRQTGQRYEGDKTIALYKDDIIIYLVDRSIRGRRETWTSGWFNNGMVTMGPVPEVYDADVIESLRSRCSECGHTVERSTLMPLSFAGQVCRICDTPELRARVEFPGWAD